MSKLIKSIFVGFGFFLGLFQIYLSAAELERPKLNRISSEVIGYTSSEFEDKIKRRPQECTEFIDFVEAKLHGPVSEGSKVDMSGFNSYGIIIAKKDGTVLFERYFQKANPSTLFKMFSVSKMLSVLSYGAAEQRGLLSRETLLAPYLKNHIENAGIQYPYWNQLKIKHLLTMSSGIPWCEYFNCAARDAVAMSFYPHRQDSLSYFFANSTRAASEIQPLVAPGERYTYSLGGAIVIQSVLKEILKERYENYPFDFILNPLGVKKSEFAVERDGQGVFMGGTGFFMNLPTMAKLGITLINNGRYRDTQIASSEFIKDMTQKILPTLKASQDPILKAWEGPTGMGLWLNTDSDPSIPSFMPDVPNNMFYSSGYQGRRLMIFPEQGDDGFIVARIGTENNHSYYWEPYSKKMYDCLGNHFDLTPRSRGTQEGMIRASEPPKISTGAQNRSSKIDLINRNIPIQLIANEFCNCAFVSKMLAWKSNEIDQAESVRRCAKFTQPDFTNIPFPLRPSIDAEHVNFQVTANSKQVTAYLKTNLFTKYTAVATFNSKSGTCEITSIPKKTIIP
ncbi:MAG: serine hydrolase [Proteobacteria bacterium]|nr:serine hydrolase [Pseudomonadota bacterium]